MITNKIASKNIPPPTNFGKNLKFLRRLKGFSQTGFAKEVGLSRSNVASYESGLVEPNMNRFLLICKYFMVQPREMLESIMAEHVVETTAISVEERPVDLFVAEQIDDFVKQTNEMTKVLEGYQVFFDMQKQEGTSSNPELQSSLQDLLTLLSSLVKSNWSLIQSVMPIEEEE